MKNFTYHNPTKILFGKDTTDRLADEMKDRGKNVNISNTFTDSCCFCAAHRV